MLAIVVKIRTPFTHRAHVRQKICLVFENKGLAMKPGRIVIIFVDKTCIKMVPKSPFKLLAEWPKQYFLF